MANKLTTEHVQGEVLRFWNAFSSKNAAQLKEFYAPESSVFSSVSNRSEPGRLAAARREREYFNAKSTVRSTLGPVEVILLGEHAAVASYNFQFHASRVSGSLGSQVQENIEHGRATQVFAYDIEGKLRIMHEHLSALEKG